MQKGGYQVINLDNRNHIRNVGVVHDGVYDKIEGTRKVILLSGIVVDGVEYHDTFIHPQLNGSNYVAIVGDNPITSVRTIINIKDNDIVTFTTEASPT